MTWAFAQKIGGNEKLVLLALADHADEDWSCFPGQRVIATKASISERTVRDVLNRLREKGLVGWELRNSAATGYRTSNRYVLAPGLPADSAARTPTGRSEPPTGNLLPVEGNPQIEPSVKNTTARAKMPQETEMVEGWEPERADVEWGLSKGFTVEHMKAETERFVNHFLANGGKKRRWNLAWRNWMTNRFVGGGAMNTPAVARRGPMPADRVAETRAIGARLQAQMDAQAAAGEETW